MGHPDQHRDRHEQHRAKPEASVAGQSQPQGEGEEGEGHRQRGIDEAELKGMPVGEGQGEQGGRRDLPMHFLRHPEEADHRQRRHCHDDQLHRQFEAEDGRERHHQQVHAEIADQRPFEAVIAGKMARLLEIDLDLVAPHMTGRSVSGGTSGHISGTIVMMTASARNARVSQKPGMKSLGVRGWGMVGVIGPDGESARPTSFSR
jgi:hypothetical protein